MDDETQQAILNVLAQAFGREQAIDIVGKYRMAATIAKQQVADQRARPSDPQTTEQTNGRVHTDAVPA